MNHSNTRPPRTWKSLPGRCTSLAIGIALALGGTPAFANDDCADVTPENVAVGSAITFTGNSAGATPDGDGFLGTAGASVWHAFTISDCADVTVSFCDGPLFENSAWNVLATVCHPVTIDDFVFSTGDATVCANGNLSRNWTNLQAGTYWLPVPLGPGGPYAVTVTTTACTAGPSNDDCANATVLTPAETCVPTAASSIGATESIAPITCGGFTSGAANDVWFQFVATAESHTIQVANGTFDVVLGIYSDCASLIACVDDVFPEGDETLAQGGLTVGGTYYVRVYGWAGATGTFDICVLGGEGGPCPAGQIQDCNGNCAPEGWLGDGDCDAGQWSFNGTPIFFNCDELNWDDGDCDPSGGCTATAPDCVLSDDAAYQTVIADDSWCCNNEWDEVCQEAFDLISDACIGVCIAAAPDCVLSDDAAYQTVIADDDWCCNNEWDGICQDAFDLISDACLPPSCPAEAPGCVLADVVAYQTVVADDPSCCDVAWAQACQDAFDAISDACTNAPANDDCANAIVIGDGVHPYSTVGATGVDITSCTFNDNADIWYEYVATCDGLATATTCNDADYDTALSVWDACDGNELGCNDDASGCGTTSTVSFPVSSGTSYWIRVAGFNGATGTGNLTVSCNGDVEFPENDECADATVIGDGVHPFSTVNAFGTDITSCTLNDNADIWYEYVATCDGLATVSTCDDADFDTALSVWDACDGNELGCNDDGANCGGFTSSLSFPVSSGTSYWIRVAGYNGATGTGNLTVSCNGDVEFPENDECADAITLTVGPNGSCPGNAVEGDMTMATGSPGSAPSCLIAGLTDVWYAFNSGDNATIQWNIELITMGAVGIQVLDACEGNEVFCQGDVPVGIMPVAPNTDYILRILTLPDLAGTYTVCLEGGPPVPVNNDCDNATELTVNTTCVPTSASSMAATESMPASTCSGWTSAVANDVWFQFTATGPTQTIEVSNGSFDVILGIYSDCGTLIDCVDDVFPAGNETLVQSGLTVGATYHVRVYGWAGATGTFDICVYGDPDTSVDNLDNAGTGASLWPNPNNGQELWFEVAGLPAHVRTIAVDIHDLSGKRIVAREMALPTGQAGTQQGAIQLDLNGGIAAGTYVVSITAGDQRFVERLVIAD